MDFFHTNLCHKASKMFYGTFKKSLQIIDRILDVKFQKLSKCTKGNILIFYVQNGI